MLMVTGWRMCTSLELQARKVSYTCKLQMALSFVRKKYSVPSQNLKTPLYCLLIAIRMATWIFSWEQQGITAHHLHVKCRTGYISMTAKEILRSGQARCQ